MLINLRNALMTGKRLPYDAEVEYLKGAGTQYIDTPVVWNPFTTKVTVTFSTTATGAQYIFGSYGSAHNFIGTRNASGSMQILPAAGLSSTFGDIHTVTAYNVSRTYYEILDGTETTISNANSNTTRTLSIFRINGITTNIFNGRIYRLYLTDIATGQITADFIPVRKGTVGYLYDRVSGKLFGNAGSGDFVVGPDVVPVEYIESHGTEYIDTGIIPTNTTGCFVKCTFCVDNNRDNIVFGCRQDSGDSRYWVDMDCGGTDSMGWGFNKYSSAQSRFIFAGMGGEIAEIGLNYNNDRSGTINGTVKDSFANRGNLASISRSIYLFCANNQGVSGLLYAGHVYSFKISQNSVLAHNYKPVRVGTGSTWEGAMMDVLTRRIYRNAGTGAFTYGNDLKYPIPAS